MDTYNNTDQRLHLLSQIIAKINRTFIAAQKDDSHTNLFFDPASKRLYGRWISTVEGTIVLALNILTQSFEWVNNRLQKIIAINYINKTIGQIEEEIAESLTILGIQAEGFNKKMHYSIPEYSFANEKMEAFTPEAINQWSYIRRQANEAAMLCLGMVQQYAEIRIWPHHFDTGIYLESQKELAINFGFAMQDEMINSPYMYISGTPKNKEINYLDLPDIGIASWEVNNQWKGAVLPYTELNKLADKYRKDQVEVFINNTIIWYLNH